eukprot:9053169-Alexandrium_andersonii.AAC.1
MRDAITVTSDGARWPKQVPVDEEKHREPGNASTIHCPGDRQSRSPSAIRPAPRALIQLKQRGDSPHRSIGTNE